MPPQCILHVQVLRVKLRDTVFHGVCAFEMGLRDSRSPFLYMNALYSECFKYVLFGTPPHLDEYAGAIVNREPGGFVGFVPVLLTRAGQDASRLCRSNDVICTEPLYYVVPEEGVEPSQSEGPRDFESRASASFATPAPGIASILYPNSLQDATSEPDGADSSDVGTVCRFRRVVARKQPQSSDWDLWDGGFSRSSTGDVRRLGLCHTSV